MPSSSTTCIELQGCLHADSKSPSKGSIKGEIMTIGVAVIGAGMAGRSHAAAYRVAPTLYESTLPDLRFVSIGDINPELGSLAARRFGYERNDTSWQAIAENPDINVVSVVVANNLHREIVEGLVAAGKHVLCEKPLSDTSRTLELWPTSPVARTPRFASASLSAARLASRLSANSSPPERWVAFCMSTAAIGATTHATRWLR
jgi:Oxidoreductase family, NAD-binding Rossmann fold